jgi:hypothetical protein
MSIVATRPHPDPGGVASPAARGTLPTHGGRVERWALAGWVVLVAVALVWGTLAVADAGVALRAAPVMGRWHRPAGIAGLLPALGLAAAVVAAGPAAARRLPWRALPPLAALGAAAWAAALAAAAGWDRVTEPLTTRHEYEPLAAGVDHLGGFLATYVERLGERPVHVQGHPPGPVVVAWALDRAGLGGAGWLAALVILAWGVAAAAALVAARAVAGEAAARRAAPALVLLPAAVWAGTSLDALFAGIAATAVALAAGGTTRRGLAAGVVLGSGLLCTYAMGMIVAVAAAVAWACAAPRARRAVLAALAAGTAVPLALAAVAGFWWPVGLAATGAAYWSGIAAERPGLYLTVAGNPGALALATGPAVAAGLAAAWTRRRAVLLLTAPVVAAVALADLSQMARGEVERIWLLFVPLLAVAAPGHRRGWLAAQAAVALAVQATLSSPW